jgi:hypothetical protein
MLGLVAFALQIPRDADDDAGAALADLLAGVAARLRLPMAVRVAELGCRPRAAFFSLQAFADTRAVPARRLDASGLVLPLPALVASLRLRGARAPDLPRLALSDLELVDLQHRVAREYPDGRHHR